MISRSQSGRGIVASIRLDGSAPSAIHKLRVGLRVPTELWGAANAVAAGFCPPPHLRDSQAARSAHPYSASSEGALLGEPPSMAETMRMRLDFKPSLKKAELPACLVLPALVCTAVYALLRPASISIAFAVGMAALYAALLSALRAFFLELQYIARQVSEAELADEDSRFKVLDGVAVHYKVANGTSGSAPELAVAMYHGFGANTFSWSFVDRLLADSLQALVTSHDMPGFGLTQRSPHLKHYTLQCNGSFGRQLLDAELAAAGHEGKSTAAPASAPQGMKDTAGAFDMKADSSQRTPQGCQPGSLRRVLIGHSMGGACAAAEVIKRPEGVSALILVAPAIVAPMFGGGSRPGSPRPDVEASKAAADDTDERPASRLRAAAGVAQVLAAETAAAGARCVLWLAQPALVLALRAAVRSRLFWERGLGSAWFLKSGLSVAIVDAYRLPQLVRGWEMGLLRFVRARASGGKNVWSALRSGYGSAPRSQAERLAQAVAKHNIRVLIVHGENDALVPAWNSQRLAALLPGCALKLFPETGHMPMEERPDQFVATVSDFLSTS